MTVKSNLRVEMAAILVFFAIFSLYVIPSLATPFETIPIPSTLNSSMSNQVINFTINNTGSEYNITQVNITLPATFVIVADSDITTASNTTFSSDTNTIYWTNDTETGFVNASEVQYFSITVNVSSISNTTYDINVSTLDTNDDYNSTNTTITVEDIAEPTWSGNSSTTPANYSASNSSIFYIILDDDVGVNVSLITIMNSTDVIVDNATMTNDTSYGSGQMNFSYSIVLPAGTFNWTVYANDTSGLWNSTDAWNFTIGKADNPVNLYLNGTANANRTYTFPAAINATATFAGGTVYLFLNDSPLINDTSPVENVTLFGVGLHTYSVNASGNENYSDNTSGIAFNATVIQGTLNLSINFTPSSTVTYGNETTATGIENNVGDEGIIYELWRDSVLKDNTTPYQDIATLDVGTYTYRFNATGNNNWSANPDGFSSALTVQAAPNAPFVSTGGSSADVPVTTKVSRDIGEANVTFGTISANGTVNVTILKTDELAVRKLSITVKNKVTDMVVNITKLSAAPSSISYDLPVLVFNYIKIENSASDTDITRAIIRFAVTKDWMDQNGLNQSNISLYRWDGQKWTELGTNYTGQDAFEFYFEAVTPGFSTFAIGESGADISAEVTATNQTCSESWSCAEWSDCTDNVQTRTCTDANSCGTYTSRPAESQDCAIEDLPQTKEVFPIFNIVAVVVLVVAVVIFVLEIKGKGQERRGKEEQQY